jgi:pimeloyl-ACP methyl ester carboxylesterase
MCTLSQINMESYDDDLKNFEAHGAAPLPVASDQGYIEHGGARIWYETYGSGSPVILLHGGLGHSGNWGYQVPELVSSGHRAVLIDSRGHGRSTRDLRPFTYELMASDVLAVMDALHLESAAVVGWSDGACTGLVLARQAPARIAGVFYFACNMDPSGTKPFELTPTIQRCLARHTRDYAELSATPDQFQAFAEAVQSKIPTRFLKLALDCPSVFCHDATTSIEPILQSTSKKVIFFYRESITVFFGGRA